MRIRVSTCMNEPIYAILTVNVPFAEDNMILVVVFLLPCYDFGYLCKMLRPKNKLYGGRLYYMVKSYISRHDTNMCPNWLCVCIMSNLVY